MKETLVITFLMLAIAGCTGSAIRGGTMPALDPVVASTAETTKENDKNTVSAIYNGADKAPIGMTKSIPYWVMENGEARVEHIYFKPLYIVVN
jgi:hypothetical protein